MPPPSQTILRPAGKRFRNTKIVATIGPATRDAAAMTQLVEAGVNVARFNVKHNTDVGGGGCLGANAAGRGQWGRGGR